MQKIRTFVAIATSSTIQKRATSLIERLRCSDANVNWVKPDNLHLTLKFVGDVPNTEVSHVCRAVGNAVGACGPFSVSYEGIGAFPNRERPKVIWIGVGQGSDRLVQLHAAVDNSLSELGFLPERRPYQPHLTVGRLRRPVPGPQLCELMEEYEDFSAGTVEVSELLVMASFLGRGGPTYDVMARFRL
ncbi:MAG: RNA 2',3'-cyclic phosphodiesterase [Planctomycetaceae bacterium]|nr:RNA 2',3'-cyclic phosphodiesterase [Planctomycetaceae bacterium]